MRHIFQETKQGVPGHPGRAVGPVPRILGAAVAAAMLGFSLQAQAQTTLSAETQRHLKASVKNSGGDVEIYNNWRTYMCSEVEDPNVFDRWSAERRTFRIPLLQIFDDLWYVGDMYVGQFILKAPGGGFILIDTLNNSAEVDTYTMPALKALGLGPGNPLLAVLLTHGHGDHDGGARRLRELFPAVDIYIGSGDANNKAYSPIQVNSAIAEPQERNIGGVPIVFQSAPGHTPGTVFYVVPVHQDGKEYKLLQGGRNGSPGAVAAARNFMIGMERNSDIVKMASYAPLFANLAYKVWHPNAIMFDNNRSYGTPSYHVHTNSDGTITSLQKIQRDGRSPNPFIIGNERALRALASQRECAAAWLGTRDATAAEPTWRVTKLSLPDLQPFANTFTAQLASGWGVTDPDRNRTTPDQQWGPIAGQTVQFSVDDAAVCTAVTDAVGTATCAMPGGRKLLPNQRVSVTFAGQTAATFINLPSSVAAPVPVPGKGH